MTDADRAWQAGLEAAGVQDLRRAQRNLQLIASEGETPGLFAAIVPQLLEDLRNVPDPDMALNNLERYLGRALSRRFLLGLFRESPRTLDLALTIFGSSQFLADILTRQPALFEWLLEPGLLRHPRRRDELRQELADMLAPLRTLERKWGALRRFKAREILRIGLQDLRGHLDLAGVTEQLATLADVTLEAAVGICEAELTRRHGVPLTAEPDGTVRPSAFAVIGLGKLGGGELNFSSDIDLMFVYTGEGETAGLPGGGEPGAAGTGDAGPVPGRVSNKEFYRKLGEMLVKAIGEVTPEGHVFRVDMRLRPEGRAGDLASSLRSIEVYYESWGQNWERMALIKARPVAGDPELGAAFLDRVTPFVYRKYVDYGLLGEIRAMKAKITLSTALDRRARRNVKLGTGGIREIEFIVQAFQLLYGGQNPWLREPNTLRALQRLQEHGLLTTEDYTALVRAYTFLRTAEHRLQVLHQTRTHTLPEAPADLARLARRMGYTRERSADPEADLRQDYGAHTAAVRRISEALLADPVSVETQVPPDPVALFFAADFPGDAVRAGLAGIGFENVERAFRNLEALRDGPPFAHYGPESRRALARLAPGLLQALREAPDPDLALNAFERFVASVAARTEFLKILADHPPVLTLLLRLFGASEFLGSTLIYRPEQLDVLLEPGLLEPGGSRARLLAELREATAGADAGGSARLDALRRVKKAEELRIGVRDIVGGADILVTQAALTTLAEACLTVGLELADGELRQRYGRAGPDGFAILGLGKLGAGELTYGSDLDVAFVYRAEGQTRGGPASISHREYFSKLADRVTKILTTITQEGAAYRVDARLRPGGQKGDLAVPLPTFADHFARLGETWERQAYIKAWPVAGDPEVGRAVRNLIEAFVYQPGPDDLARTVMAMRKRMAEERGGPARGVDIKLAPGGMGDIEFLVQYLQLREGRERPSVRCGHTLEALRALGAEGLLAPEDSRALEDSYRFLRRVENRLRIVADRSVTTLPTSPVRLERLARRLGQAPNGRGPARERFLAEVRAHTTRVRSLYTKILLGRDQPSPANPRGAPGEPAGGSSERGEGDHVHVRGDRDPVAGA